MVSIVSIVNLFYIVYLSPNNIVESASIIRTSVIIFAIKCITYTNIFYIW